MAKMKNGARARGLPKEYWDVVGLIKNKEAGMTVSRGMALINQRTLERWIVRLTKNKFEAQSLEDWLSESCRTDLHMSFRGDELAALVFEMRAILETARN